MAHETADYVLDDWILESKKIKAICNSQRWKGVNFTSWTTHMPLWVYQNKLCLIGDIVTNNIHYLEFWNPKRYAVEGAKEYFGERI